MRDLVKVFKALSDTNRIRILKMLEVKALCVCEIRQILDLANSTVSRHLSILREANLIRDEKDGKWVNFRLNIEQNNEYVRHLLPLIRSWLPNDELILRDQENVKSTDRNSICSV